MKLQECYSRLTRTRQFMDDRQKIRDESKPRFDAGRAEFQQLNEQCRALFDEHKMITSKLKELRENASRNANNSVFGGSKELAGAGKEGHEALKDVKNMAELEIRIKEYQYRLETASMPILEEKKLVGQISFLTHRGRDFIKERDELEKKQKVEIIQRKQTKTELEDKRKALDAQIDEAKAKLDEKKKAVDKIRADQMEKEKKLSDSSPKIDRSEEKKKIDEIKATISKMRDDFGDALDKWYLNKRIIVEQQKIVRRKKYEAIQAEREEKRKAWEAEQAQYPEPHPYQAEKDMCSGLTVYLKTLLGETIEKQPLNLRGEGDAANKTVNPTLSSKPTREIQATTAKAVGKMVSGEADGFNDVNFHEFVKNNKKSAGSGRKKAKGRKSQLPLDFGTDSSATKEAAPSAEADTPAAASDENSALKPHSIDYLTAFSKLGIKAPTKISEARAALEAVQAKAAFYETAPAPSDEDKEKDKKEVSKSSSSSSSKKNRNNHNNNNNSSAATATADPLINGDDANAAFPGLVSDAPKARSGRDMPSFMAVAEEEAGMETAAAQQEEQQQGGDGEDQADNKNNKADGAGMHTAAVTTATDA